MQRFTRLVLNNVPALLVIGLVSWGAPCVAQEVDAPSARTGSGSIVAPSPWLQLTTPVQQRADLKVTGFYIGELKAPSVQVDLPIRATKFLTITPSYLYYSVPASGLDELANVQGVFTDNYAENQFRIDGNITVPVRKFEISVRNMYVRRFRPDPAGAINRYRGRIQIARSLAVRGHPVKPFASYETFYDQGAGWDKDRVWAGVTLPVMKRVLFQPSYMWESSDGVKKINYLLLGLIVTAK